jgi:hypothetical protein
VQCQSGLTCDEQTKQCATAQFVGGGQPCGFIGTQAVFCTNGVCEGAGPGTPGSCAANADLGAACDLAAGPSCAAPARCISGSGSGNGNGTAGTCSVADGAACH